METSRPHTPIASPDWTAVRPIYKKLSDEFPTLTGAYGLVLDSERTKMLDHLIIGIDEVDRCVDELPTKVERDGLTTGMVDFLEEDNPVFDHTSGTALLQDRMEVLKRIVDVLRVAPRFAAAARKIFDFTERKRHTTDRKILVDFVIQEGRATAELPLSLMGVGSEHPFALFFIRLCTLMGVADLIVDARSDYRKGYIQVRPSLGLYFSLLGILVSQGVQLLWHFPRKWAFFKYCLRCTWLLLTT